MKKYRRIAIEEAEYQQILSDRKTLTDAGVKHCINDVIRAYIKRFHEWST